MTPRRAAGAARERAKRPPPRKTGGAGRAGSGSAKRAAGTTGPTLPFPLPSLGGADWLKIAGVLISLIGAAVGYGKLQADMTTVKAQVASLYEHLVFGPAQK